MLNKKLCNENFRCTSVKKVMENSNRGRMYENEIVDVVCHNKQTKIRDCRKTLYREKTMWPIIKKYTSERDRRIEKLNHHIVKQCECECAPN